MGSIFSTNNVTISPITKNSPQELFVEIFLFLEPTEVECCSLVCQNWTKIVNSYFRTDILNSHQILEIFKFLPRNELDKCQLVSKIWNGVVLRYNDRVSLRPVYYTIEQRRNDEMHVINIGDFTTDMSFTLDRKKMADVVSGLKNCHIEKATVNFRKLPTGIFEHLFLNNITSPEELSLFYDGDIEPISLENELVENIKHLKFDKFWCGLVPVEEILIEGRMFGLSSLKSVREVILYWEKVSITNFDDLLDFLFDSQGGKREKCDVIIKNIGLMVDYFVERFLHDEELDISGMFEEMEFTGVRDFFPEFYQRTNFENPSNFRNGKAILRIWMEDQYDGDRATMNAIVFEEIEKKNKRLNNIV